MSSALIGKFQPTTAPSTTPHCCPLAESLRLLLCCIRMPSIFWASPLPSALPGVNPQAAEATPGGYSLAIAGELFDKQKSPADENSGASEGGKAKPQ